MLRQAHPYEKKLLQIIKEYDNRFYYHNISKVVSDKQFTIEVQKPKEEMVGKASVVLNSGERIDYEFRYNRIINLNEGYNLLVPMNKF